MSANSITAYHEAGHATMAILQRVPFDQVRIYPAGDTRGEVTGFCTRIAPITGFAVTFAGIAAEALCRGGFRGNDDPLLAYTIGLERADRHCWRADLDTIRALESRMPRGSA